METSAGLWSALTIVAAVLVVIGVIFIAARVLTAVRSRRARESPAVPAAGGVKAADRGTDRGAPQI